MQDETQEASATSSPDPLSLNVPEDRDIDLFRSLPNSAGSSEAWRQNKRDFSRGLLESRVRETGQDQAKLEVCWYCKLRTKDFRTNGDLDGLEQQPARV